MKPVVGELLDRYVGALDEYVGQRGEAALERAYEVGRSAVSSGLGVLEMMELHERAMDPLLQDAASVDEAIELNGRGSQFFRESLSVYEMTHRGFREANDALQALNRTLEQRVRQRTAALETARSRAEAANQAKADFLAVVSHELRTPLNAVIGYTELLTAGIYGPLEPEQIEHMDRIRASAGHLLTLIEEILTFSRLEAGREEIRAETVELDVAIRAAADVVMPAAADRGLDLRIEVPRTSLLTDHQKLRQILINLIANAVKFTERGEVVVRAREERDALMIDVVDTGIGIAPEHLESIFEPFSQLEHSTTRSVGGTGLGLSVSRRLARLLGGDITVVSTPGKGSTFTLRLPRRGHW